MTDRTTRIRVLLATAARSVITASTSRITSRREGSVRRGAPRIPTARSVVTTPAARVDNTSELRCTSCAMLPIKTKKRNWWLPTWKSLRILRSRVIYLRKISLSTMAAEDTPVVSTVIKTRTAGREVLSRAAPVTKYMAQKDFIPVLTRRLL